MWLDWRDAPFIVQPETVIRWHHQAFKLYWRRKSAGRRRGRPPLDTAPTYLLRDRDKIFGDVFQQRVGSLGIKEVLTAYRSPWQNAYVERINGSIRRECTDHIIAWNERHLKKVLQKYFDYYNNDRTHLGLAKEAPIDRRVSKRVSTLDQLVELRRVGGLHHRYEWREAA